MPASPPQPGARERCRVIVLGSTGSIGTQTLEVISHLNGLHERGAWPTRYEVVGLAGGCNHELVMRQGAAHRCKELAIAACDDPVNRSGVRVGPASALGLVSEIDCDLVVAAMSGAAGLPATLAAVKLGRDIALANKETLVAAGELIVAEAHRSGSRLLPVDSEHSALWQCLGGVTPPPFTAGPEVSRVFITASGGPFRTWTRDQLAAATPEQARKHPTWSMGPKVTVDSASLVNKAFEIIEARWLFGLRPDQIEVLIHPQSLVHALAEYADGSVIAHVGAADMRVPIQYALASPHRPAGAGKRLNFAELRRLDFEPPDHDRFPVLRLAYRALEAGGSAGAVFNAAAEAATEAFCSGRLRFDRIGPAVAAAMDRVPPSPIPTLDHVLAADRAARDAVAGYLQSLA